MYDFDNNEIFRATGIYLGFDMNMFRNLEKRYSEQIRMKIARFGEIFDLKGGTSTIENWRLKQFLLTCGIGAFAPYTDGKLYFLLGNTGGILDHNYLPTEFIFANPHMPDGRSWSGHYKIGTECVIARNDDTNSGIMPIIRKHTFAQVQTDLSFYMALISSRMTNAAVAGRDSEAAAVSLMFDDIETGKITAITDKNVLQELRAMPYGGTAGVLKDYIEFMQYDKAAEANELGLKANWNAKRETLTSSETLLNDDVTHPFVDNMKRAWEKWIDEVNAKYGDLLDNGPYSVEWASSWETNEVMEELEIAEQETAAAEEPATNEKEEGEQNDAVN